ncbi:hypothetical protein NVV93_10750 [Pseudomonas sp. LS44]|nr:hypothetical protein [Pseudomonas sp. LS44]UVE16117.1 hypothetical protein NVV93_10750 [Pseudomonas sp. LS44]
MRPLRSMAVFPRQPSQVSDCRLMGRQSLADWHTDTALKDEIQA